MSETDYISYFLASPASVVHLDLLEISHPQFDGSPSGSHRYRIVRNKADGVTVTLEDASSATFDYYPLRVTVKGAKDDLDAALKIDLGDLGEVIPAEIERVLAGDGGLTYPTLIYRVYRSDDLTAPILGPLRFQIEALASTHEGSAFEAVAPKANVGRVGEFYTVRRFPMLRGYLT